MDLSYILNADNVGKYPLFNSYSVISKLPFFKENFLQYKQSESILHADDVHFARIYDIPNDTTYGTTQHSIRIYCIVHVGNSIYNAVMRTTDISSGNWELLLSDGTWKSNWDLTVDTPKNIISLPSEWAQDSDYDTDYGIGTVNFVYAPYGSAYKGWGTVLYKGKYTSAYCESNDGINWDNFQMCVFDSTITSKLGSWRCISGSYFDDVEKVYYAALQGRQSSGGTRGIGAFIKSTDGINWTLVSLLPPLNCNNENIEASQPSGLCKVGNYFIVTYSRYDYAEKSTINKNPNFSYSLDGIHWENAMMPWLNLSGQVIKYPYLYFTTASIYLGYILSNTDLCIARMDWCDNPPIKVSLGDFTANEKKSLYSLVEGNKKACITIKATASGTGKVNVNIYPAICVGPRMMGNNFSVSETACITKELDVVSGSNVLYEDLGMLPEFAKVEVEAVGTGLSEVFVSLKKGE